MQTLIDLEKGKNATSTATLSNIYIYMRLIADHTLLLGAEYCTDNFRSKKLCAELGVPFPQTLDDFILPSAKLQYLNVMLDKILVSHKVLIFSQFKGMADLVGDFLALKGIKCLKLSGDTPNSTRQKLIDQFDKPECKVFILSTRAGGLGLNLTQADTVFIMDSDFNPHCDQQALSRAHRIGQKNNVIVYRFVCKDSVEERILEQAKRKMMLDTAVQQDSKEMMLKVLRFGTQKLFEKET